MATPKQYWLIKSEPSVYSIDDLARDKKTGWSSVRNYQARNHMRDGMKTGDLALFYHSSAEPPGVAGIARVDGPAYADPTQFDKKSEYFDPKAKKDAPTWMQVDFAFVERFPKLLALDALRAAPALAKMLVLQRGQRLSVQPVTPAEFAEVLRLAGAKLRV
jgi:predicted RNA-binding protein with PUA-like domain